MKNYKYKMGRLMCLIELLVAVLLTCACATFPTSRYQVIKEPNSSDAPEVREQCKLAVAEFASWDLGRRSFSGRPFGDILLPEAVELYIKGAFIAELNNKGMYLPDAPNKIRGSVDSVGLDALGSEYGTWTIRGTIFGESSPICTVEIKHKFVSAWNGNVANANSSEAFPSAVRVFVLALLNHPDFVHFVDKLKSSK